jgi:hypothetical protein
MAVDPVSNDAAAVVKVVLAVDVGAPVVPVAPAVGPMYQRPLKSRPASTTPVSSWRPIIVAAGCVEVPVPTTDAGVVPVVVPRSVPDVMSRLSTWPLVWTVVVFGRRLTAAAQNARTRAAASVASAVVAVVPPRA